MSRLKAKLHISRETRRQLIAVFVAMGFVCNLAVKVVEVFHVEQPKSVCR